MSAISGPLPKRTCRARQSGCGPPGHDHPGWSRPVTSTIVTATTHFAIYLASKDALQESALPSGFIAGTPEEALDRAGGLYLDKLNRSHPEGLTAQTTKFDAGSHGQRT